MKKIVLLFASFLGLTACGDGQTIGPRNEDSQISFDRANAIYTFSWSGRTGIVYRIKYSEDLAMWRYFPGIVIGAGAAQLNIQTNAPRFFIRLEVALDTDGDGMSNDWEIAHGLDPFEAKSENTFGDSDHDGFTNLEEFIFGLNTNINDFANGARTHTYSYDNANRLIGVSSNLSESFTYDEDGNLSNSQ